MQLPDNIKHAQEVWIPALLNITKKLNIPTGEPFNIDKAIEAVKKHDAEVHEAYVNVMNTFEAYSLYYHALKRKEPGSYEQLQKLERDWQAAENTLNKMVDYKARQSVTQNKMTTEEHALRMRTNATIRRIKEAISNSGISSPWLQRKSWSVGYSHTNNAFLEGEFGFYINIGVDLPQADEVVNYFINVEDFKHVKYEGGNARGISFVFVEYKRA